MEDIDNYQDETDQKIHFEEQNLVCKAIFNKDEVPLFGKLWKQAKRCDLTISPSGVHFNDQHISMNDIKSITVQTYQSPLFIKCCIITIKTEKFSHHFATKYSDFWEEDLGLPVEIKDVETPYLKIRMAVMACIIIYIIAEMIRN